MTAETTVLKTALYALAFAMKATGAKTFTEAHEKIMGGYPGFDDDQTTAVLKAVWHESNLDGGFAPAMASIMGEDKESIGLIAAGWY